MPLLAMAMLLAGTDEAPRRRPVQAPPPPGRIVVPPVPPPGPSVPVLLRAPDHCGPIEQEEAEGKYDFTRCFNAGDYPVDAWLAHEQGVANVRVTLDANGRPSGCEIAVSSGSAALDQASCDLLRQRVGYAISVHGSSVTGAVIAGDVRWVLPDVSLTPLVT